jgi:hypothetical protein
MDRSQSYIWGKISSDMRKCENAWFALKVVGTTGYWSFSFGIGVKFAQSSSQREARAYTVLKEMSQTLLTNKKQGNLD